jgi:lysophospholipase L1-like esterase
MTNLTVYGNSYAAGVGASSAATRWSAILANRLGMSEVNRAVGGDRSRDTLGHALGVDTRAWTTGTPGLVALQCALNDLRYSGVATLGLREFRHCLRTLLTLFTVAGVRAEQSAADLYAGAWTQGNSFTASSGGTNAYTTAQWASATVGFSDTEINVLLPVLPGAGPVVEFRIDGVPVRTVDYTNQCASGAVTVTERFNGLAPGGHLLTVAKVDPGSAPMFLDCFLFPGAAPRSPLVLVTDCPITAWSGFAPFNQGSEYALAAYRGALAAVAADFPSVRVADPRPAWNTATMLGPDGVHPNDLGHSVIADAAASAAAALGF